MSRGRVAVLGCGPAGLLSAHAAIQEGLDVDVLSVKKKSELGGAQFLHSAIPGVTDLEEGLTISFLKIGDAPGYAEKVYGNPGHRTSWAQFGTRVVGWNLRTAYDRLWEAYSGLIVHCELGADMMRGLVNSYDLVISSVPRTAMCHEKGVHHFTRQNVWIRNVDVGLEDAHVPMTDNVVVYCGTPSVPWYRASKIFGVPSVEYARDPLRTDYVMVGKPLYTSCTCWSADERVLYVGRFGTWEKGVLVNDAYREARNALRQLP